MYAGVGLGMLVHLQVKFGPSFLCKFLSLQYLHHYNTELYSLCMIHVLLILQPTSKATLVDVTTAQGCKGSKHTRNASHPSLPDTSSSLPPRDTLFDPPPHDTI